MQPRLSFEARIRRTLSRSVRPVQVAIRRTVLRFADEAVMLQAASPDQSRVLLVRLDNIGDFIVWLDAARTLVQHFRAQGKRITLAANAVWSDLARDLGIFDEVIPVRPTAFRSDLRYRHKLLRQIRAARYGVVLQPTLNRVPDMGDAIVRVCGAIERVGVALQEVSPVPSRSASALYTRVLAADPAMGEMLANATVVRALTGRNYKAKVADLSDLVSSDGLGSLVEAIPSSPYVVLFPGASAAGRQWPERHFAALACWLSEEYGLSVLVCGGPDDVLTAERVVSAAGAPVVNLAERTTLGQLVTIIAGAALLISNETSAIHMAAALGTTSICITGGGHFGRFMPYVVEEVDHRPLPMVAAQKMPCFGCNWVCDFHPSKGRPMPCVESVSLETVMSLVKRALTRQAREVEVCV